MSSDERNLNSRFMKRHVNFLELIKYTERKCPVTVVFSCGKHGLFSIQSFVVGIHKPERTSCISVVIAFSVESTKSVKQHLPSHGLEWDGVQC
jgi:hypothetical protein